MSHDTTIATTAFDSDESPWPVGTDSFFQPRRAAFWLLSALIVNGLFYPVQMFSMGFRVVPITAFLGLVVWGLYTLAFLLVFRTLDLLEQHPPEAFVLAFAWGGMGAVYFAAPANIAIQSLCAKLISPEFVAAWGPRSRGRSPRNSSSSRAWCCWCWWRATSSRPTCRCSSSAPWRDSVSRWSRT